MKKISTKNLPTKIPLFPTMFLYMFMDYYNAPEWLWGIVAFVFLIFWGMAIYNLSTEDVIDIFEGAPEPKPETKKRVTFQEKLKEKMNEKNVNLYK